MGKKCGVSVLERIHMRILMGTQRRNRSTVILRWIFHPRYTETPLNIGIPKENPSRNAGARPHARTPARPLASRAGAGNANSPLPIQLPTPNKTTPQNQKTK